ncbi:aromatic ring-hydroxylating oxygenase subunit alpha [Aeoliella sp.]|uniref:aromatic ring-hydroxylating oxygenase subunit alpha n=1 Tax=Aeoliella sp. TaxID=2795800 RepID=UPI003CCC2B51
MQNHTPRNGHQRSRASRLQQLVDERREWNALVGDFYREQEVYQAEIETIWKRDWLLACHTCEIPNPGDYVTLRLEGDSAVVIRDHEGQIRAHWNVCRHRGSELCAGEAGHAKRLVCPYHQWTYAVDGHLVACRGMHDDFDQSDLDLMPVAIQELEGLVFISFADNPPDFNQAAQWMGPMLRPQGLLRAKVAKSIDYEVAANWKLVWENNRECYHCKMNHPQYVKANFDQYDADGASHQVKERLRSSLQRQLPKWEEQGLYGDHLSPGIAIFPDVEHNRWYSANRTVLAEGFVSESVEGQQVAPLMGSYTNPETGTLRIRTVPNMWNHSSCDHAVTTRLMPDGIDRTRITVTWLVDQDAMEGRDYELSELLPFWQLTSEQDWKLCERVQRGVLSTKYRPGPLSRSNEYNLEAFFVWYLQRLRATTRVSTMADRD